ncbi:hypothetical protein ZIOFF_027788 [Zingiber officinale]|uniref:Deoxyuridine 5'-triphosphate nucleotidohydrolase n=1 Tax=Zingiber officinale TaxID=94328 RepID=A0A8J5GR16_ZINOF|nr:hypothetical protein ZIOFF_027788 [Zingiber officinale]
MALIVFRDNRWMGDQAILATMEVDLTQGSQLVYVIPNIMLTIRDFYRNIQVSILTRGYDQWQGGETNLLITRRMVGRLSNTPNVGFAYEATWRKLKEKIQPEIDLDDGSLSGSLGGAAPTILVTRLSPNVGLPKQKSSRATRFDLAASEDVLIPPRDRKLIPTYLRMEIPFRTYDRIATRSGIAWNHSLDVGAGVIDSDYRGKIFILLFNHSDFEYQFRQGDYITQIIFEKIIMPEIFEAKSLSETPRGGSGFGSTSERIPSSVMAELLPQERHIISALISKTPAFSSICLRNMQGLQVHGPLYPIPWIPL